MDFENFKNSVKREVESRIGADCNVTLNDVTKNNGVKLSGLTVQSKDTNVSPVIYLNNYYSAYERGSAELEDIISDILDVYEKNKVNHNVDMSLFLNYENIKGKIIYTLINTDRNRELLQHISHIPFLDLSIVFKVVAVEESYRNAVILIRNEHLEIWNVSLEELYKDACHNTPTINKYELKNIRDVINGFVTTEETVPGPVPMLVLSNKSMCHGAACVLYPDLLKHISCLMDSSMYIIPSSVHEGATRFAA